MFLKSTFPAYLKVCRNQTFPENLSRIKNVLIIKKKSDKKSFEFYVIIKKFAMHALSNIIYTPRKKRHVTTYNPIKLEILYVIFIMEGLTFRILRISILGNCR